MTRFVNSSAQTAADQSHVDYALLVTLDFAAGAKRVFNGLGTLVFNGQTFLGLGEYGAIDVVGESTDLRPANPVRFTLAGVDPTTISSAMTRSEYYGRSIRIDICILDSNMQVLTPIENAVWEGRMDRIGVNRDLPSAVIELICEDRMVIFDQTIGALYTSEFQALTDSSDTLFDQSPFVRNKVVNWGGGLSDTRSGERTRPPGGKRYVP